MKTFTVHKGLVAGLILGLLAGVTIVYAGVTDSFKIKENKIFFNLVSDPEGDGEEVFLPSVVGRTGHVYIYKLYPYDVPGALVEIKSFPGDSIEGSIVIEGGYPGLSLNDKSVILVGDEENHMWWRLSSLGY